jgi:hypothetical protein
MQMSISGRRDLHLQMISTGDLRSIGNHAILRTADVQRDIENDRRASDFHAPFLR